MNHLPILGLLCGIALFGSVAFGDELSSQPPTLASSYQALPSPLPESELAEHDLLKPVGTHYVFSELVTFQATDGTPHYLRIRSESAHLPFNQQTMFLGLSAAPTYTKRVVLTLNYQARKLHRKNSSLLIGQSDF